LGISDLVFGRLKKKGEEISPSNHTLFLLILLVLFGFGVVVLYYGFVRGVLAQGRYLFPALPAIGILFISGLKRICPRLILPHLPFVFITGMVCLDLYALFGCLLPYYHLR
jgi:hypothetical protein